MKKNIALIALAAAALLAVPAITRAQDAATPAPAAPAHKNGLPFKGKIVAVDATAATVTVGTQVYNITSETKITKDGKPATLADFAVGDTVAGAAKKSGDKMDATVLHSGKKKAAQ